MTEKRVIKPDENCTTLSFQQWKWAVNAYFIRKSGMSIDELPDYDVFDLNEEYENGTTALEMVNNIITAIQEGEFD